MRGEVEIGADRDQLARRERARSPDIDGMRRGDLSPRDRGTIGQCRRSIARPSRDAVAAANLEPVMQSHLPAGDSRAVVFATTADGLRLPVIDVTHPAFAIPDEDRKSTRLNSSHLG